MNKALGHIHHGKKISFATIKHTSSSHMIQMGMPSQPYAFHVPIFFLSYEWKEPLVCGLGNLLWCSVFNFKIILLIHSAATWLGNLDDAICV